MCQRLKIPLKETCYVNATEVSRCFKLLHFISQSLHIALATSNVILFQVFNEKVSSSTDQETTVVSSILDFFPVFDAFDLPPPTVEKEILKNINQEKDHLSPSFLRGLEKLKVKLRPILSPKRSFNDGEFVTGEGRFLFFSFVGLL